MPKRKLRADALARRRALDPVEARTLSLLIQQRFLSLPEFLSAGSVALYAAIQNEVDTSLVAEEALRLGKKLIFPATVGETLSFRAVASLSELKRGKFGIPEPDGESLDPSFFDVIVVPGICFDQSGRRIGYGKGYYDRSLHRMERSGRLVAFCYDFQLLPEIFGEPHDVLMDLIITENRVVRVHKNIGGIPL